MNDIDFSNMTDDEIRSIQGDLNAERNKRIYEEKLPVYCCDGMSMKHLPIALTVLKNEIDAALNYPGGPEVYFGSAIDNKIKDDLLTLKIEFWSKSEYDARPDTVWG